MVVKFAAQIMNGQLRHKESLAALEGQEVQVTVIPCSEDATDVNWLKPTPIDELDIERNVYVRIPFEWTTIPDAIVVDEGPLRPSLVMPENLPND